MNKNNYELNAYFVVNLKSANKHYGGKALGLANLMSKNLPVPNGIALLPKFVFQLLNDPNKHFSLLKNYIDISKGKKFAIRSSAINEDGISNSFAGIYETILNVPGKKNEMLTAIKKVYSSQISSKVLSYAQEKKIKSTDEYQLGIIIQEMITPVIAGVAFTSAINVNGQTVILLECVEGLGDKLVNGEIIPTRIEVPLLLDKTPDISKCTFVGPLLNMTGLDELIFLLCKSKKLFKRSLDIEWAIDSKGTPWLLQARPITKRVFIPSERERIGTPASSGLAKGITFVIDDDEDIQKFPDGNILVAKVTETKYLPAMRKAIAIITEEGGILSHAAIVSREMAIPCIVGYEKARETFPTGSKILVDGTSGFISVENNLSKIDRSIKKQDIDWGAAYLFEYIIPVQIKQVTGLFNPTPTNLALHLPEDIKPDINNEFEMFSRKHFGQSPKRYQSDKYLWFFEWKHFQNNTLFLSNLQKSIKIIEQFDGEMLALHYDSILNIGKKILRKRKETSNNAIAFLYDETLLTIHFLLTMLIPEGYALELIYCKSRPLLDYYGFTFSELLAGHKKIKEADQQLDMLARFAESVSKLRNDIYNKLINVGIIRDDYFEDRIERASKALSTLNITYNPEDSIVSIFYKNIHKIPEFKTLTNFL